MRIVYRIIDKDDSDDDCLYELMREVPDGFLYWAFQHYTNGDIDYPTLYFTSCRNLHGKVKGLAGALKFEPADLEGKA